jgi:predicted transcriptional regulator
MSVNMPNSKESKVLGSCHGQTPLQETRRGDLLDNGVFNNNKGVFKLESTHLMFELSHPERLKILSKLREKHMRLSELSKSMAVTTAEVSRHTERLVKAKLVEKNGDNYYRLTPFAFMILTEYSNIEYLTQNLDFFMHHNLTTLPRELHWFTAMADGELVEGALEVTSQIWDHNVGAKKFIYVISDQIMRAMVDITCKKIDSGVVVKKIYSSDAKIPSEYFKRNKENHEIRTMDDIPLALIVTDKNAGFSFRGENGNIDFSTSLKGDNENFRRWAAAVFEYFWKKAKPLL